MQMKFSELVLQLRGTEPAVAAGLVDAELTLLPLGLRQRRRKRL
jgi:hypothetical protein